MQSYIGKNIDRYHVLDRLGMGGMAVVYKAYDTRLEREVALKLIRTESIPQDQHDRLLKRFEREAKAQARFHHPNIIPVHDYGEVDGSPYLVMTYVPGGTLKEKTGQPVDYRQAIQWLLPVAGALAYAHEMGIIHRDIKPSNILFDTKEQPILTDFGIAKILETDEGTLTGTGLGVGTPEYMAPEQWQGKASQATDQYALGVVLYELVTGQKPYKADTPVAVALMQMTEPLRAPSQLQPDIPEGVEKIIYKALARDPQDRYESMEAFRTALRGTLREDVYQAESPVEKKKEIQAPVTAPEKVTSHSEEPTYDALESNPTQDDQPALTPEKYAVSGNNKRLIAKKEKKHSKKVPMIIVVLISFCVIISCGVFYFMPASWWCDIDIFDIIEGCPFSETIELASEETPILVNPKDGALMVYVPEGKFLMGSEDEDAWEREKPEQKIVLNEFWIYQHEVTNEQYRQCVSVSACHAPQNTSDYDNPEFENHPVVYVNWLNASEYCEWAGGRLPSEAEWEKAARGTDGRKYPWGDENPTCNLANYAGCVGGTAPVGSYPDGSSPYGAMDMAGNVWEWILDWFEEDHYSRSLMDNPSGPESGNIRVVRSGSWMNSAWSLRGSLRYGLGPSRSLENYGFRCILTSEP